MRYGSSTKVILTEEQLTSLLELCPSYHACVLGPADLAEVPVRVEIDHMFVSTREEAEEIVWLHVCGLCERIPREFDKSEWSLMHVVMDNGN